MSNLDDLPNEVLMKIFVYLELIDVTRIAQVSKRLRNFCKDESLMQKWTEDQRYSNAVNIHLRASYHVYIHTMFAESVFYLLH